MPQKFFTAPNQHRLYSDLQEEPGNTAPPPFPGALPHIHSKTACRGFESFCPCQKSQVSLVRYLTFFVSVRKDLATRCARRPACGACRGVSERQWRSVANRPRRQPRPSPSFYSHHTMGEFHPLSPVRTCCTPLQHPKRTRFRLFLAFPGTFRCFCPLLTCKIFGSVFVHPAA